MKDKEFENWAKDMSREDIEAEIAELEWKAENNHYEYREDKDWHDYLVNLLEEIQ